MSVFEELRRVALVKYIPVPCCLLFVLVDPEWWDTFFVIFNNLLRSLYMLLQALGIHGNARCIATPLFGCHGTIDEIKVAELPVAGRKSALFECGFRTFADFTFLPLYFSPLLKLLLDNSHSVQVCLNNRGR